jgi:hypothetical protein
MTDLKHNHGRVPQVPVSHLGFLTLPASLSPCRVRRLPLLCMCLSFESRVIRAEPFQMTVLTGREDLNGADRFTFAEFGVGSKAEPF